MANSILKPNGEYLTDAFAGPTGRWKLVGIESVGREVMSCLDTYKNERTGEYTTKTRLTIFHQAESGIIK